MWRALALVIVFFAIAWLEFEFVPGHSYLQAGSQLYVPILQHLQSPGYLSRDLVASHANVTYTGFDEITLFLQRELRIDFHRALLTQQILCRLAALLGLFLLARSAGLRSSFALAAAAIVNSGVFLPGLNQQLIDPEPVPRGIAVGLIFLAAGCLGREKPLLAGLSGGIAFIYDPVLAVPFWMPVLLAFCFDKRERRVLRPMMPILLVFVLLLANLAQLQPGAPDVEPMFAIIPSKLASIQTFRLPQSWVSHWPRGAVTLYFAQFVIGMAAVTRIWSVLNRHSRWIFTAGPLLCLLTIPFCALFIDHLGWSAVLRIDPLRCLFYLVALSWLAVVIAGWYAVTRRHGAEAALWLGYCALFFFASQVLSPRLPKPDPAVSQLAAWARETTWGDALFLFPDAGCASYPSEFRARSERGLWVDWTSGEHINSNSALAYEWWNRWRDTMERPVAGQRMQQLLKLPIDYFVLKRNQAIENESRGAHHLIQPAFVNSEFRVYEAGALRFAPGRVQIVRDTSTP
ncbi:MAG TPA: hypothetical protein VHZ55_17580 [Bryobacteraceae bacterium]|jgi:hypothetical protein|nr:hypothetical protein [Bryobacteraceae bacterium]